MLNLKITAQLGRSILVIEIRPLQWKLFWSQHKSGLGFILGPVGVGVVRQIPTAKLIESLKKQAELHKKRGAPLRT